MYYGWMSYAGTEIINATRTVRYAESLMPTFDLLDCYDCARLPDAIADNDYVSPTADEAPWYDVDVPESADFLGLYPLTLIGFEDSTRSATGYEAVLDGGYVTRVRHGIREMRVGGLLVGKTPAGASYGLTWLKSALGGSICSDCEGNDLCFLTHCPDVNGDLQTQAQMDAVTDKAIRHLRRVTCVDGPRVIKQFKLNGGGSLIQVEFNLVAATPWLYGEPKDIASAQGETLAAHLAGALVYPITTLAPCVPIPPPSPIIDPDCPPVPSPPSAPLLTSACGTEPASFFSYAIFIPETAMNIWQDAVPILTIETGESEVRHVRIRFMARPLSGQQPDDLDPCGGCASFVINYIPGSTKTVVDGMTERVTMQRSNGAVQSAEHLVTGVGTEIFDWPVLSCGVGYYVIVDVDVNSIISLDLFLANRE